MSKPSAISSEIRKLHQEILGSARTTLDKAIRIGELLTEQKAALKHGQRLPWIEENCPFDRSTASNYMRVFGSRDELKCRTVLHLSDAYQMLATTTRTEPERTAQQ